MSDDLSIPNPGYQSNRPGRYGRAQRTGFISGMDPDTRRLVFFAGGLGGVLLLLIGASALTSRHSGEIPVITADARPIKEKPKDPGGMKIDGAENDVFSGGTDTKNAKLAPAAEAPDPKTLRAGGGDAAAAPRAPAVPPAQAPVAAAPVAPAPAKPAPVAVAPPAPAQPAPAKPAVVSAAKPPVAPPATAAAPAAKVAAPAPAAAPAAHAAMVQLAAVASEDAARAEWQHLQKRMPDLLGGKEPSYSKTERDGRTFWRVRTSGFADVAQARGFCEHVRAKGGGCSVADF